MNPREMMNHFPDDELLSAYLDGELSAAEQATVESWLAESAEHRQMLEELRSLSQSLESLPRLQLEDDFYKSVLRRAEREMLSADGGPKDGRKLPLAASVDKIVSEATAAKPNSDPNASLRDTVDIASEDSLSAISATGRRLRWPRGKRPWVYAAAAIAAAVLVMLMSPHGINEQNFQLAKNNPPPAAEKEKSGGKEGIVADATPRPDAPNLAFKAAPDDRPVSEKDNAAESYRRKSTAANQDPTGGRLAGYGNAGGGTNATELRREAGDGDGKPGPTVQGGEGTLNQNAFFFAQNGNMAADKQGQPGPLGNETLADGVAYVEVTLTPEGLKSDAIRLCLARQHIVLEDEVSFADGNANMSRFNVDAVVQDQKGNERAGLAPAAKAQADAASSSATLGDKPAADRQDSSEKDRKTVDDAAKGKTDAASAGRAPRRAGNRALAEAGAGAGGFAGGKHQLGLLASSNELVLVEADANQITGALAYLQAHPEYFSEVDVRPSPQVEEQQAWSSYKRVPGEQVNEAVKQTVRQREQSETAADRDSYVPQNKPGQQTLGVKAQIAEGTDKLAENGRKTEEKKAEKAASAAPTPTKPMADAQVVDKRTADNLSTDKPTQPAVEDNASKDKRAFKMGAAAPKAAPLKEASPQAPQAVPATTAAPTPLATKPAEAANAAPSAVTNGTVATQPAASQPTPPPAAIAAPIARPGASGGGGQTLRKAGIQNADVKSEPETRGLARTEEGYSQTFGRARRLNVPSDTPRNLYEYRLQTPGLQQQRTAEPAKASQLADKAKLDDAVAPASAPAVNAPLPTGTPPGGGTRGTATAAPAELKSEIETKAPIAATSKSAPRGEPTKAKETDDIVNSERVRSERAKAGTQNLRENQQAAQAKDGVADKIKGVQKESEALDEKLAAKKQAAPQAVALEAAPHNYQRAVIVVRIQQPAAASGPAPAAKE